VTALARARAHAQISMTPKYAATTGAAWLERGGCYVEANIRGGGEFGPSWWASAKRDQRNKAYEDFEAVAEDLIASGQTTASMLACRGGSNGGLLVGNAMVRRPELWGAVVCAVPLLDMKRFNHLLAGASWMAECAHRGDTQPLQARPLRAVTRVPSTS
jgi:prolyl oligopeptidase